jgi:hypothetical protein
MQWGCYVQLIMVSKNWIKVKIVNINLNSQNGNKGPDLQQTVTAASTVLLGAIWYSVWNCDKVGLCPFIFPVGDVILKLMICWEPVKYVLVSIWLYQSASSEVNQNFCNLPKIEHWYNPYSVFYSSKNLYNITMPLQLNILHFKTVYFNYLG